MNMKAKIQPISIAQVEQLQQISRATFRETFADVNTEEDMHDYLENRLSISRLTDELSQPESFFYFAMIDGHAVGYLKLNTGTAQTEHEADDALEVERIYVLKDYQSEGIGRLLFRHALATASEKQCRYVWLGVWEHNEKALRFYRKNGFEVFSKHVFRLGSDDQTDLMMRKEPPFIK